MTTRRLLLCAALASLLPYKNLIASERASNSTAWPYTFTDAAGRSVRIQRLPKRIIVGNYIVNFLLVGGKESISRIVGITRDHWESARTGEYKTLTKAYPELLAIPSIGGYHDNILNSEKIISLKPDVLLISRAQFQDNQSRIALFERSGIKVVVIDYHAMTAQYHVKSTLIIGHLLGREDRAGALSQSYLSGTSETISRISALPDSAKYTPCYMELGNKGVSQYGNTYNRTVLWGAILHSIKAGNIAENMKEPWGAISREYVISKAPRIIIIGGSLWNNGQGDQMLMGLTVKREDAIKRLEAFKSRALWETLPAVQTNDFYAVDHGSLRAINDWHFMQFLAKIFYPEAFSDVYPEKKFVQEYRTYLPEIDPSGTFMLSLK